eukprot:CAMPEP_0176092220 /NCGR_PEP_ID=MMETSP0120_2-20121206/46197_1 /TAXON_ID=160619 /ORGANISM="Kryptoperidinium foliaceum, Strain CCMP 1326" /LENGTH=241 /DNA_ID=CAMNT_0017426127 /DNA_START=48 /DNA_END=773 /DNA_ORIENTATION=+
MAKATHFQIRLSGAWQDYAAEEDKILRRAYLAGYPNASYRHRGNDYLYDFREMKQINKATGKSRDIRPPRRWTQPATPVVPKGPTTCIRVPPGASGTVIQVPHPLARGQFIACEVPAGARAGQEMLVPVPVVAEMPAPSAPPADSTTVPPAAAPPAMAEKRGHSTGAKVAMGLGGAAVAGGAVAGGLLGAHIADEGWDAAMADLASGAGDAGDAIVDGGEAIGHWAGGAVDTIGDFVMDLF